MNREEHQKNQNATSINHCYDYLNANENEALRYQKIKKELEGKYAYDSVVYTKGKKDMIDIIVNNQ